MDAKSRLFLQYTLIRAPTYGHHTYKMQKSVFYSRINANNADFILKIIQTKNKQKKLHLIFIYTNIKHRTSETHS